MTIEEALTALSQVHGAPALAAAFRRLQGLVRTSRKASAQSHGVLAQTYTAAMQLWEQLKADGVSRAERDAILEKTLRAAWPQRRAWHYLCETCGDLGLQMAVCPGDAMCGRTNEHGPHDWGAPCWCAKGARFRSPSKPSAEDFSQAGKMKPARLGRW